MAKITITARPPFREITGRWAAAHEQLLQDKRKLIQAEAARMRDLAREEAPKRHGKFAQGIRYRTFISGMDVGFEIQVPAPLGDWIALGTPPHVIEAKNKRALKFLWMNGPKSSSNFTAYHFYRRVFHPGTKPNPFLSRAFARWLPGARAGWRQISRDFIRNITGASVASKSIKA